MKRIGRRGGKPTKVDAVDVDARGRGRDGCGGGAWKGTVLRF